MSKNNLVKVVRVEGSPTFHRTIADMHLGESGYTVPWAFEPSTNTLDLDYPITDSVFGTSSMNVKRLLTGRYSVSLKECEWFKYSKKDV